MESFLDGRFRGVLLYVRGFLGSGWQSCVRVGCLQRVREGLRSGSFFECGSFWVKFKLVLGFGRVFLEEITVCISNRGERSLVCFRKLFMIQFGGFEGLVERWESRRRGGDQRFLQLFEWELLWRELRQWLWVGLEGVKRDMCDRVRVVSQDQCFKVQYFYDRFLLFFLYSLWLGGIGSQF